MTALHWSSSPDKLHAQGVITGFVPQNGEFRSASLPHNLVASICMPIVFSGTLSHRLLFACYLLEAQGSSQPATGFFEEGLCRRVAERQPPEIQDVLSG